MENARLLGELRQRTEEVAELNRGLEARVAEQVEELGRVGRLKRFLAPQLAELIVSQGDEKILESHRREIVVVFCDLRGYTAFTETAEPEEVLDFLREYHGALGPLVTQFEGTLDQFSGDGIMVCLGMLGWPGRFHRNKLKVKRYSNSVGDLVLQSEQIACVRVEPLGPEMGIGLGVDQLGIDADLIARTPDTPFKYVPHTKLSADLLGVGPLVLVGERRIARDHEHARDP
jgi:hypothetical protein